ncbi:MAG: PIN domain-containing protein [Candidatus Micrarchaeota archaeon]
MELVADTNVVVSAVLKAGLTRNLLFNSSLDLCSPDFLSQELEKHKAEFVKKSGLEEDDYLEAVDLVLSNILQISFSDYRKFEAKAKEFSPDFDDWPFFAVALCQNCSIWSDDKLLKKQKEIKIYITKEILEYIL